MGKEGEPVLDLFGPARAGSVEVGRALILDGIDRLLDAEEDLPGANPTEGEQLAAGQLAQLGRSVLG
eukprot:7954503-Alexandrium_andersonii.AAC.1